eukprot:1718569-Karenia_brevis.AAC.1
MSVRPWLNEVNPVAWDRCGVGGEVEEEEEMDEEEGEDPERLRLREDGEMIKRITQCCLVHKRSRSIMRWVMQCIGVGVVFVLGQ